MNEEEIRLLKLAIRSYPTTHFFDLWSDGKGNPICFRPLVVKSQTADGDWLLDMNDKVHKRDKLFTEQNLVNKEIPDSDMPF